MNCSQFNERLQDRLDGLADDSPELHEHLAGCPACRELHAAARRLEEGLRLFLPAVLPPGLAERIADRHLSAQAAGRFRRRLGVGLALAASLLLVLLTRPYWWPASDPGPTPSVGPPVLAKVELPKPVPPSLNASVADAGSAVVALARRTTGETVEQTRVLWPDSMPVPELPAPAALQESLNPPAQGLSEVRQGMYSGLEPVTNSARRAVGLFLRDLPPLESKQ